MNNSWIKLHRKLIDWGWYTDSQTVHLFLHLLFKANYKPSKWRGVEVAVGQLITGRTKLAMETGISEQSVRTILDRLKSTGELTSESTSKFTIITLCNYSKYQGFDCDTNQQLTSNQPATNQQLTTSNNLKEVKKKEPKSAGSVPALAPNIIGSLPLNDGSNFDITENFVSELSPLYPACDVVQTLRAMKGWLIGNPDKKKTRRGVKRFITNWLAREQDKGGNKEQRQATATKRPVANTQAQKNCQNNEDMAMMILKAEGKLDEGYTGYNINVSNQTGVELPSISDDSGPCKGTGGRLVGGSRTFDGETIS